MADQLVRLVEDHAKAPGASPKGASVGEMVRGAAEGGCGDDDFASLLLARLRTLGEQRPQLKAFVDEVIAEARVAGEL